MMSSDARISRACVTLVVAWVLLLSPMFSMIASPEGWLEDDIIRTAVPLSFIDSGDVDRDGTPELYTLSVRGNMFKVSYSGDFFHEELPSVPDMVKAVMIGDVYGNNYDHLYAASVHSVDDGRIYELSYNGGFWDTRIIYDQFGGSNHPLDMAMGDANDNHVQEIYFIDAEGNLKYLYYNGWSWFSSHIYTSGQGYFRCLAVGDGDNDGVDEIYVGTDANTVEMFWFDGVWNSQQIFSGENKGYWDYIRDVVIGDPDEDGDEEVLAVVGDTDLAMVEKGATGWDSSKIWHLSQIRGMNELALGDGDDDGREELFSAGTDNMINMFRYNEEYDSWGKIEVSRDPLPNDVNSLVVAEVDGSPDFEEIYAACENGKVYHFSKDVEPPPAPEVWSDTHPKRTWKNDDVVKMEWKMTESDPSGISGYSYSWSTSGGAKLPNDMVDIGGSGHELESQPLPEGDGIYFSIKARDGAGNWGKTADYGPIYIDMSPPADLEVLIESDDDYTHKVKADLEISALDELSGPSHMSFSNDGEHWSDWFPYSDRYFDWDLNKHSPGGITDGERTVHLRVKDGAGNTAIGGSDNITLDQSAPTGLRIEINGGEDFTSEPVVSLSVSADDGGGGSKLAYMSFSNDGGDWSGWEIFSDTKGYWDLERGAGGWEGDGRHKVFMKVKDLAGNIAGPVSEPIILDRTPPSDLEIIVNSGRLVAKNNTLQITVSGNDLPDYSGLDEMAFKEDGMKWGDWQDWGPDARIQISSNPGMKIIYMKARDRAGNEAEAVKGHVVLDGRVPRISNIRVLGVTDKNAVIHWMTDLPAMGKVKYGKTLGYGSEKYHSDLLTSHSVTLSGLRAGTGYHFSVEANDAPGQAPTVSRDMVFTTKDYQDMSAPVIRDVEVEVHSSGTAIVSWKTNEPSDSRVKFGKSPSLGNLEGDSRDVIEHRVILPNLDPDEHYFFTVLSSDPRGNGPAEKSDGFRTPERVVDTAPPTITNLRVKGVTDKLAVASWTTNEPTLGVVEYGTGLSGGHMAISDGYRQLHRIVITGLVPDTGYHLRAWAIDMVGNGPVSSPDQPFFTADTADQDPPVLSNIRVEGVTSSGAVISWATDEPSDGGVEYYTSEQGGETVYDLDLVESHSITLVNLEPETEYTFRVLSYDVSGNGPTVSEDLTLRTNNVTDIDPPSIFDLRVKGIDDRLAVVMWDTNELASGKVLYGLEEGALDHYIEEEGILAKHSVVLWDLEPATSYYFQVSCTDSEGNGPSLSEIKSFRTLERPDTLSPVINDLEVTEVTDSTVTVEWSTDEPGDSRVEIRAQDGTTMIARDARFLMEHSIMARGLEPNTTYHLTIRSADPSANEGLGEEVTITTEAIEVPRPPGPDPPPDDGGGGNGGGEGALAWVGLMVVAVVVLGLLLYSYRRGASKGERIDGGAGAKVRGEGTDHVTDPGGRAGEGLPRGMALGHLEEGLCPHCGTKISLENASTALARREEEEARRRRKREESRRKREEVAERHRRRIERLEKDLGGPDRAREKEGLPGISELTGPGEGVDEAGGERGDLDRELEELYDEVEEVDDDQDRSQDVVDIPVSPLVEEIGRKREDSGDRQVPDRSRGPLKTVRCGNCDSKLPVYSKKRPLRITCPSCGRSGTLRSGKG